MQIDIISLFPESFHSYFSASILKRAQAGGKITLTFHNLRDFTSDKHRTVDDTPYGGGAGMVLKVEPISRALNSLVTPEPRTKTRVILFSAKGKKYTQADARRLSSSDRLILVCGRYEGVDERIAQFYVDEEISIGDYVLTGGEIPAMVVVDSIVRLLPGVLGNEDSLKEESHELSDLVEYPQYTKPEVFENHRVPEVLLSGNHGKIKKWRDARSRNAG